MSKTLLLLALTSTLMMAADGAALFKKCSRCHGAQAQKKALGKSNVINQFTKQQILTAIKGYKNGTYGGSLKSVMKIQVSRLSDEQVNTLAEYISNIKK